MIEVDHNVAPRQIRTFGFMLLGFAALLGGVTAWRGEALSHAALLLGAAWLISLVLNGNDRSSQMLGIVIPLVLLMIALPIRLGANSMAVATVVWMIGTAMAVATISHERFGRMVYVNWMLAAVPIGWTISHAILAAVYYGVLTPIGLVMRICRRDPMERYALRRESYWKKHQPVENRNQYFKQF